MTSRWRSFKTSVNREARKTNASLLARIGAEKKVDSCWKLYSYRSFGPLIYVNVRIFQLVDIKTLKSEHVKEFY